LNRDAVHVWKFTLAPPQEILQRLGLFLSEDEIQRANRFHFPHHRDRFIAAHGCLREILSRYTKCPPQALQFQVSPFGKPSLVEEQGGREVAFNLSHSHDLGLVAVTRREAVGVDIEYIRTDLADEQVARRFFSKSEVARLLSLPDEQQKEAFFLCWTRKEAFIKAIGQGLSMPLDRFDVTLAPGEPAQLLATRPDPAQALQWRIYHCVPAEGYAAAVAVAGQEVRINYWEWNGFFEK
jgi:4'-phosphopantetheinyl transferase